VTKIADTLVAAATKSGRLRRQNLITEMEAAYNCRSTPLPSASAARSFPQSAVPLARVRNANAFRSYPMEDIEGGDAIRQWSRRSTSERRLYVVSEDLEALDSRANGNAKGMDRD